MQFSEWKWFHSTAEDCTSSGHFAQFFNVKYRIYSELLNLQLKSRYVLFPGFLKGIESEFLPYDSQITTSHFLQNIFMASLLF